RRHSVSSEVTSGWSLTRPSAVHDPTPGSPAATFQRPEPAGPAPGVSGLLLRSLVGLELFAILSQVPAIVPDVAAILPPVAPILPDVVPIPLRVVWPDVLRERRRRQKRRRHTGHRERDCEPHGFSPPLRDDCCALGRRLYVVAFTSRYISRNWLMLKAPTVDPRSLAARLQLLAPRR